MEARLHYITHHDPAQLRVVLRGNGVLVSVDYADEVLHSGPIDCLIRSGGGADVVFFGAYKPDQFLELFCSDPATAGNMIITAKSFEPHFDCLSPVPGGGGKSRR